MRYSLLSRFQGCLIGAMYAQFESQEIINWSRITFSGMKSLVKERQFEARDWQRIRSNEFPSLDITNNIVKGELLGLSLPIALFYHENETKLQKNLLSLVEIWQCDSQLRDGLLAMGYTIAQSLKEKLSSRTLIPQILTFIDSTSPITQNLAKVQTLLEQGSGLERAVAQLSYCQDQLSSAVALGMYCFLSSLEDFRLSILRAARTSIHPITPTIVGALAGTYNSTVGIPAPVRMILSRPNKALGTQKTDLVQMLDLVDNLLATWSGMYERVPALNILTPVTAIAAPNVIR